MKVLYGTTDTGGCAYYRMYMPAKYLILSGLCDATFKLAPTIADAMEHDLYIVQGSYSHEVLKNIDRIKSHKIKVAYEIDDNVWEMDDLNPHKKFWGADRLKQLEEMIGACDAIITTNSLLASYLSKFKKRSNIYVVSNYIEKFIYEKKVDPTKNKLYIGWAGGDSHDVDFSESIVNALTQIQQDHNCELVFMGYVPDIMKGKIRFIGGTEPAHYMGKLNSLQLDIGIIPCADISFNRYKSCVKFYEYAFLKIPTIASNVTPYKEELQSFGLLADNTCESWYQALSRMLTEPSFKATCVHNAYTYVVNNKIITSNVHNLVSVYAAIINQKGD